MYRVIGELNTKAWVTPEPVNFENKTNGKLINLKIGEKWGDLWDCAWFNFTGVIDETAKGKKVSLLIDVNGEACVFDDSGCPIKGLTTFNTRMCVTLGNVGKRVYEISNCLNGGEAIDIWAEAGCNDLFGVLQGNGTLKEATIAVCNEETRELYYDFAVLNELLNVLDQNSARYAKILDGLSNASYAIKSFSQDEINKALQIVKPLINAKGGDSEFYISAIGHAHIDLAWTWPVRETIRKATRTFSTVLKHMESYPEYKFGASQIQLYAWMKDRYPLLFEKIKQKVAEGRWEVQGGMWCEPDANVPSGESLVRQFLYGKRFVKKEFNKDIKVCWLPDTFGYTGALPQIIKKADMDYLIVQKIMLSPAHFRYPHDTFFWEGVDESKILTHVPPYIYSSSAAPQQIMETEIKFKDKLTSNSCILLFGQGDGGGGPGAEHLECLKRVKNLKGLSAVVQKTALDFFEDIKKDANRYATWKGPLDLDRHTGTFTSSSKSKYYNWKIEKMLREAELFAVQCYVKNDTPYPYEIFESIWKKTLLYQFHDILTGTSINRVFEESHADYKEMIDTLVIMCEKMKKELFSGENVVAFYNSSQFSRDEWVLNEDNWQKVKAKPISCNIAQHEDSSGVNANLLTLENDIIKISFNIDGSISSIFDKKEQRETITTASNKLFVYEDRLDFSEEWGKENAWDFSDHYMDKCPDFFTLKSVTPSIDGPKASILMKYEYGMSKLTQEVVIFKGSRRIDFITSVDWQERERMLRTKFFVDIHSDNMIRGIQFGNVRQSLLKNIEWETAKLEICAHKWVDISDGQYGTALLTDFKYGFHPERGELNLCLLRSPCYPAVDLDKGSHEFAYSFFPHKGDFVEGEVIKEAYCKNTPLQIVSATATGPFLNSDVAIIEAVKLAEDDGSIIIRLYEPNGKKGKASLEFGFNIKSAFLANLMEHNQSEILIHNNKIQFDIEQFEIITIKVTKE
jgi:alpha-mannosidase